MWTKGGKYFTFSSQKTLTNSEYYLIFTFDFSLFLKYYLKKTNDINFTARNWGLLLQILTKILSFLQLNL